MTTLVDITAITAVTGALSGDDQTRAEGFLTEASDLAREVGLSSWTDAGGAKPAPVSVRLAVKAATLRAFYEDPEGYASQSLGEWSGSRKAAALDETGVYFTPREEAKIRRAAGRRPGLGSLVTPAALPAARYYGGSVVW